MSEEQNGAPARIVTAGDVGAVCIGMGLAPASGSAGSMWTAGTGMRGVKVAIISGYRGWRTSVRDGMGGVLVAEVGDDVESVALLQAAITEAQRMARLDAS